MDGLKKFWKKFKRFWHFYQYYVVIGFVLLAVYEAAVALTFLPVFKPLQYSMAKLCDHEINAYSIQLNGEEVGILEKAYEVSDVWSQAVNRINSGTASYKIDAEYTLVPIMARPSDFSENTVLEDYFVNYLSGQLENYSFVGYALQIEDNVYVLSTYNAMLELLTRLAQNFIGSDALVRCTGFDNGVPVFELSPVSGGVGLVDAELAEKLLSGNYSQAEDYVLPTTAEEGSTLLSVYIQGSVGYQTVFIREQNTLSVDEAFAQCTSTVRNVVTYTVKKGETINAIIKTYGMSSYEFFELNPGLDAYSSISEGHQLKVLLPTTQVKLGKIMRVIYEAEEDQPVVRTPDPKMYASANPVTDIEGLPAIVLRDEVVYYDESNVEGRIIYSSQTLREPSTKYVRYGTKNDPELLLPIDARQPYWITSRFGGSNSYTSSHTGLDLSQASNSEIYAAADGIVVRAEYDKYEEMGWYIDIQHDGYLTRYEHMKKLVVEPGQEVSAGELIGYMGSTGVARGTHLHFGVRINGDWVDPEPILMKSGAFDK